MNSRFIGIMFRKITQCLLGLMVLSLTTAPCLEAKDCFDSGERAYLLEAVECFYRIDSIYFDLYPTEDNITGLILEEYWPQARQEMWGEVRKFQNTKVPPRFKDVHEDYVKSFEYFVKKLEAWYVADMDGFGRYIDLQKEANEKALSGIEQIVGDAGLYGHGHFWEGYPQDDTLLETLKDRYGETPGMIYYLTFLSGGSW